MPVAPRDLHARTFNFARQVIRIYTSLGKGVLPQTIGHQLLRSGTSVGANYRESDRARSRKEFISSMGICLRELNETHYWLELVHAENLIPEKEIRTILHEISELIAIFVTIIKRTQSPKTNE